MKFGIERLLADPELRKPLEGKRVALVAHPASVISDLTHSLDALAATGLRLTAAFGPQHGLRGDKQDNMMESPDFIDPAHQIPVFSLYGDVRRPTGQSMSTFDVVLIDLQDLGCRIYTFITTLLYMLEAAAEHGKSVWVLDRPNPAGRPIEGLTLRQGWESFVGAGPIPMRHGLTLGELGRWFVDHFKLDVDYRVIEMDDYRPNEGPSFGWPSDRVILEDRGVQIVPAAQSHELVCTGLDGERLRVAEYREELEEWASRNVLLHCLNPDRVVVRGGHLEPCAGALAEVYEQLGGRVEWYGKPHHAIYDHALQLAGNPARESVLALGDGLPTDVLGAARNGFDCVFVSGGIHAGEPFPESFASEFDLGTWTPIAVVNGLGSR